MAFKIGFSVSEEKEKMSAPVPPDVAEERERGGRWCACNSSSGI